MTEGGNICDQETVGLTKSVSSSNLAIVPDRGLGSSFKELSRSLDFLDVGSDGPLGPPEEAAGQRRKSQTLPPMPAIQSPKFSRDKLKHMSLGTAFGTKKLGLSRKLSSIITVPSERYEPFIYNNE